jgi:hypothetical protein
MNLTSLWKPFVLYTCLLGLLTVGAVYFATYSGVYMLGLVGAGVLLVALAGGSASTMSTGALDHAEDPHQSQSDTTGIAAYTSTDTPLRINLLFYGVGVLLWSLTVLFTLYDTLA